MVCGKSLLKKNNLFLGKYENGKFAPVFWSLIQEMLISIIFPFLMFFVLRKHWFNNLLFFAVISFLSMDNILRKYLAIDHLLLTLHYSFVFVIGTILAKNKNILVNLFQKKPV
ncbi:hypothetical protein ACFFMO_03070 [Lederbergia wuyishanensis]